MVEEERAYALEHNLSYHGFILVESGNCSYETKARNVQKMGGQVALIIDYAKADDDTHSNEQGLEVKSTDETHLDCYCPMHINNDYGLES